MKGNFKATSALALLDNTKVAATEVKRFGEGIALSFDEIARTEKMNASRAILIGMGLPILKASMKHGEFRPWLEANVTRSNIWTKATAIKNASLYTRLAAKFIELAKPAAGEVLAITNGKAILGMPGKSLEAARLCAAIDEFVGERSLSDLLNEYVAPSGSAGTGSAANALAALPADDATLLQDIAEAMLSLRKTVTDPDTLKRLTAAQISQLVKQLDDTQEDFRKARASLQAK